MHEIYICMLLVNKYGIQYILHYTNKFVSLCRQYCKYWLESIGADGTEKMNVVNFVHLTPA